MTDGDQNVNPAPKPEPTKEENVADTPDDADVLEEDDDFEEFEDDEWVDNSRTGDENVEWEDNWDDEVEGEDDFARKLRAEIEANRNK